MMIPLKTTGIKNERIGKPLTHTLRRARIHSAAKRVATEPKIMSTGKADIKRKFAKKQPSVRPGTAASENRQRIISASLTRYCTAIDAVPGRISCWASVSAAYIAAMSAACAMYRDAFFLDVFILNCSFSFDLEP